MDIGISSGDSSSGEGDSTKQQSKSEADKQADKAISNGIALAGNTGSGNLSAGALSSQVQNRQLAQTSEGNTQVAAAFVLNVQKNVSEAVIDGGVVINAGEKVAVNSSNSTISAIYGNASATNSKIGVGVAVAINALP